MVTIFKAILILTMILGVIGAIGEQDNKELKGIMLLIFIFSCITFFFITLILG